MRGIWALGKGMTREDVALFCNVNTHTVLEWIHHFNERGIDGLIEKLRSGSPRRISVAQVEKQIIPLLNKPSCVGQVHWTAIKLHGYLTNQMGALVSYSTLLRYLHERGYCQRIPRSMPEPPDKKIWQQQREAFAIQMKNWLQDPNVELWFSDESGVEGDPRPRKRWVMKGSKPEIPYAGKHLRRNIIGAVCPGNGLLSAVIFAHCDTHIFQAFLDNLAAENSGKPNVRQIIILDNASWHKAKILNWYHFEPAYLPPYSPDFNPIERLWLRVKELFFADFFAKTAEELELRMIEALQHFYLNPQQVVSNCAISGNF
jgi:transposase